jgi:threonine dehydrogenase-like Zn-dependent dehydrogenase
VIRAYRGEAKPDRCSTTRSRRARSWALAGRVVRELTDGLGPHSVLECVGLEQAVATALEITRRGGAVGRVGVTQNDTLAAGVTFWKNVRVGGGTAPARAYIDQLLPDILYGRIEPGRVFDRVTKLDGVPDSYRAMNDREAIKVMIEF